MEKILSLYFLCCMAICVQVSNAEDRVLRIPLNAKTVAFDPKEIQDQSSLWVGRQINCQLVRQRGRSYVNEAAEQVKYIASNRIEFLLRADNTFSDGTRVTAQDVKASFDHLKGTHSIQQNVLDLVKEVTVQADNKLTYILKQPVPQFLRFLGSPNYPIFKREFLEGAKKDARLWKNPIGCGSYKIGYWDDLRKMIRLTPLGKGIPIEFYFQALNQISIKDAPKFDLISLPIIEGKLPEGFKEERIFDPYQIFLGLNTKLAKWNKREARCDFFGKISPKLIVDAYKGLAEPATDLFPRGVLGYSSSQNPMKFEPTKLNPPKKFVNDFCLSFLSVSVPEIYRTSYKKVIENAGWSVKTKLFDSPVRYAPTFLETTCDSIVVGFKANYLDGYEYLVTFLRSGTNFTGYVNEEISKRIENSQGVQDNQQRAILYQSIAKSLLNECVVYPLVTLPEKRVLIRNGLSVPGIGEVSLNDYRLDVTK